jgi:hypothetical protein
MLQLIARRFLSIMQMEVFAHDNYSSPYFFSKREQWLYSSAKNVQLHYFFTSFINMQKYSVLLAAQ